MAAVEQMFKDMMSGDDLLGGGSGEVKAEEAGPAEDSYEMECREYLDNDGWLKSENALSQKFRRVMAGTPQYKAAKEERGYGAMRALRKKYVTGEWSKAKSERVREEKITNTDGSKGVWEPWLGILKQEHGDPEAAMNYCKWAFDPSRRFKTVRWNEKNKRVEFLGKKDIVDELHSNSWALRTTEDEVPKEPDPSPPQAGEPPKSKAKPKAKQKSTPGDGGTPGGGRGKSAEDLKLDAMLITIGEYKTDVEEGEQFVKKVTAVEGAEGYDEDWAKLTSFAPKMQSLLKAAQGELHEFGNMALLHPKKVLKTMYEKNLLSTEVDAFCLRMAGPLQALQKYCTQVFNMKRASATSHLVADGAKRARKK